jgi:hypothetical protein
LEKINQETGEQHSDRQWRREEHSEERMEVTHRKYTPLGTGNGRKVTL